MNLQLKQCRQSWESPFHEIRVCTVGEGNIILRNIGTTWVHIFYSDLNKYRPVRTDGDLCTTAVPNHTATKSMTISCATHTERISLAMKLVLSRQKHSPLSIKLVAVLPAPFYKTRERPFWATLINRASSFSNNLREKLVVKAASVVLAHRHTVAQYENSSNNCLRY